MVDTLQDASVHYAHCRQPTLQRAQAQRFAVVHKRIMRGLQRNKRPVRGGLGDRRLRLSRSAATRRSAMASSRSCSVSGRGLSTKDQSGVDKPNRARFGLKPVRMAAPQVRRTLMVFLKRSSPSCPFRNRADP